MMFLRHSVLMLVLLTMTGDGQSREKKQTASALRQASQAVVSICSYKTIEQRVIRRVGTGFVYDRGTIVTTSNVVRGVDSVSVCLADGRQFKAWVLPGNRSLPVALLRVPVDLQAAEIDTSGLSCSASCYLIGNSLGLFPSLGMAKAGDVWGNGTVELELCAFAGNSGAPVLNAAGKVAGMFMGVYSSEDGNPLAQKGLAIPSAVIHRHAETILKTAGQTRSWLGITGIDVQKGRGVAVIGLAPEGPAHKARVAVGDTIVGFNGTAVGTLHELVEAVRQIPPQQSIELEIQRQGRRKESLRMDAAPWYKTK